MTDPNDRVPVTVVTGAAGGIGRALCMGLQARGHEVIAVVRCASRADLPADLHVVEADLATDAGRNAVRAAVEARTGYLTGLVNNAGIGMSSIRPDYYKVPVRAPEVDAQTLARFLNVNAHAPVALSLSLLPLFTRGWGRIVNVGTSLTAMLRPGFLPYAMSKAALESASAVLALDLAGTGIDVCVLNPGGPVDTPMARREETQFRDKLIPPKKMVDPVAWALARSTTGLNGQRLTGTRFDAREPHRDLAPIGWPQLANDSTWVTSG